MSLPGDHFVDTLQLVFGGEIDLQCTASAVADDPDARAEGQAQAILAVATATAEGLQRVAASLQAPGGDAAMQLRIAEQYIREFGNLAKEGNTFVVPSNLSDIASIIALATGVAKGGNGSAQVR